MRPTVYVNCDECKFFDKDEDTIYEEGWRHRYAPKPYFGRAGSEPEDYTVAIWPRVSETSGCGDGAKKQNK